MDILKETKHLYDLGWACHWIKPNSKAPVKAKWSGPIRDDWDTLVKEYHQGYGLGVRLGESSKVEDGYLANIDVDIKSSDPRHREEALAFLESKFPDLINHAPIVKTGYGLRLFVKTKMPAKSGKLGGSRDECIVYMPATDPSKPQLLAVEQGRLTQKQLDEGFRVRPAWELEFMSSGKQVVLPPSIHPDTKRPYIWQRDVEAGIPLVTVNGALNPGANGVKRVAPPFAPVEVDLKAKGVSRYVIDRIKDGINVDDRSNALLGVAISLVKHGLSDQEIMSVLSDPDYYLGATGYDTNHCNTTDRAVVAAWIYKYTIVKAKELADTSKAFADEVVVTPVLDEEGVKAQEAELLPKPKEPSDWRLQLKRSGKNGDGPYKGTLRNVVLVLENAVSPHVFKRNEFAYRDHYGAKAPWTGARVGALLTDDDAVNIKHWLAQKWGFEPSVSVIFEAMTCIASKNAYHPVREELLALPQWDGVERLDGWLIKNFEAKGAPEYLAQVFRKWMVASVMRTFEPGAKFDWMIILQGEQGVGKSMFGSLLFGEEYFNDWLPPLSDKDAALGLQGIRCQEFGELDSLRRNEVETIKAFVTRTTDKVRPPYGRRWLETKRQVVFFGTTNRDEYLKDDTGNRRFNPVEVGKLDFGVLKRDKAQLWAEALFIYNNGLEPSLYLTGEAEAHAKSTQKDKVVTDESAFMVDAIEKFIEAQKNHPSELIFDWSKLRIIDLFGSMGPLKDFKTESKYIQLAAKALKILNFKHIKIGRFRYWRLPAPKCSGVD